MKKFITFITIFCILATLTTTIFVDAASNKSVVVPYLENASITIDAQKDASYSAPQLLEEQNLSRFPNSPKDSKGSFCVAFDKNYIYLYVDIEDKNIDYSHGDPSHTWERESIGVILDFDYIRKANYKYNGSENICYVNLSGDNILVTYHKYDKSKYNSTYSKIKKSTISNKNGHIIYELALPYPSNYQVQGGKRIGFEVSAINAKGGRRVGHLSWSENGSYMDERLDVIGTAILGNIPGEESVPDDYYDDSNKEDNTPSGGSSSNTGNNNNTNNNNTNNNTNNNNNDTNNNNNYGSNDNDDDNIVSTPSTDNTDDEDKGSNSSTDNNNGNNDNKKPDSNSDENENKNENGSDKSDDNSNDSSNNEGSTTTGTVGNSGTTTTTTTTTTSSGESGGSSFTTVIIILAIVAVLLVAGVIVFVIIKKKKGAKSE